MRLLHQFGIPLLLLGLPLRAQQVKFIDLTTMTQRVELRYPPALPVQNGYGGGTGGGSIGDCGVGELDPRSLTVSLLSVIPRDFDPQRPIEAEFKVLNTGRVPLELPVSPHLADLQPSDASATFGYTSLALSVSPVEDRSSIGFVELYGRKEITGTTMILNPGEWIRVEANVKFSLTPLPSGPLHVVSDYWLRRATFHPLPGGFSTAAENICLKTEPTASIPVRHN